MRQLHLSLGVRFWLLLAASLLYAIVFCFLYPTRGAVVAALSVLPAMLAGRLFGLRAALLASGLLFILNTSLASWIGQITWTAALQQGGIGSLALFLVSGVVGRLHDLGHTLNQELSERKRAETQLQQYRQQLEQMVAERTLELQTANQHLLREICDRTQIEEELQQALEKATELNALKSRFSSMVSHEFRTPLALIQTSTDILQRYGTRINDDHKAAQLDKIQTQVQHMVGLLDDILVISRAETVGLDFASQPVELGQWCSEIVNEWQQTAQTHRISFSAGEGKLLASIDLKLMRRALTNLLSNAVKYSPDGSSVQVSLRSEAQQALISVLDQGMGIPEEDQKDVFEIFHRAQNVGTTPGTGLGLSIVKQAVNAHGGTIHVNSRVGVGTIFTLAIPLISVHSE